MVQYIQRFIADGEAIDRAVARDPEAELDAGVADRVQLALGMLPPDQREAFLLKYVEELSYEEISGITGVGVSALKMRVKRACDGLRDLLEGVYND